MASHLYDGFSHHYVSPSVLKHSLSKVLARVGRELELGPSIILPFHHDVTVL